MLKTVLRDKRAHLWWYDNVMISYHHKLLTIFQNSSHHIVTTSQGFFNPEAIAEPINSRFVPRIFTVLYEIWEKNVNAFSAHY